MTLTRNHALLEAEVKAHLDADALVAGTYWQDADNAAGGKGCFIGCLTHTCDPAPAFERFGLTEPIMRIAENIFEALPAHEGKAFFAALPAAVGRDGKDLSRVHWAFLASELRALPPQEGDVKYSIDTVAAGMDLLAAGEVWSTEDSRAAGAAADAARAASAARAARAAYTAAYAADVTSARIRQRDTLLRLISEAV